MLKLSVILLYGMLSVDAGKTCNGTTSDFPEVTTPLGKVKGSLMTTRLGKTIYAFRGIRYGEPPTGQQRFKVSLLNY